MASETKKMTWTAAAASSVKPSPKADFYTGGYGNVPWWPQYFTGEKNLGEIGPIKNYRPNYEALRIRSWQSYYESEIAQIIINKFKKWVIGNGLKLQCEPLKEILEAEKIKFNFEDFNKTTEARFKAYSRSKNCDYGNMLRLNAISDMVFLNTKLGGDILVVLRYVDNAVKIQLIDGSHVRSPVYGTELFPAILENGNKIINGIEFKPNGEHAAYYVRTYYPTYKYERIPAKGATSGLTTAFMVYSNKYRLDNVRGVPLLATVLETLKKLERYKEATVGSAEERQKIVYYIKHGLGSTNEDPFTQVLSKAYSADNMVGNDIPIDAEGHQFANNIQTSTNKMTFNMPNDSELKALESKNELYFKDFYTVNIDIVCACVSIPPEVAMSKYDSNYSASRAANKDWEHTLLVEREDFSTQFLQNVFEFFLETEILKGKIYAPGYLQAKIDKDDIVLQAYRNVRFAGKPVPHIDPLKEVQAERAKLGPAGALMPLTTPEAATETLHGGEYRGNMEQFKQDVKDLIKSGIKEAIEPQTKMPAKKEEE